MPSREWRLAVTTFVVACFSPFMASQSNQEWIALKQKCGIPAGTAYNDWVAAGSKCGSGSSATGVGTGSAEQLGTALGNMTGDMMVKGFHNLLHGTPPKPLAPVYSEQQQRTLAAQQLNNSGIYLLNRKPRDYAGAINEFEKALQQTPNDPTIAANLRYAKRLQKESATAGQTSAMLGNALGDKTFPVNAGNPTAFSTNSPNVFNQVNLDPNVVDFRGMFRNSTPATASSYLPAANANALHAVLTGADAGVVDLRGAARTSVDPKLVQSQMNGIFGNPSPHNPQGQEIDKLFQSPPATAGAHRSATDSKPTDSEQRTKDQLGDLFSKPDAAPHH